MPPIIRAYTTDDKPALLRIFKRNVPASFAVSEIEDFSRYLEQEAEMYFVVELNEQIIGGRGINFEDEGKTGVISWDFIHPEEHGKGIGGRLLNYRLRILKSMVWVQQVIVRTSQVAFPFYQKHGFVTEKVAKDHWAPGFDLYEMRYGHGN